jgi:hypothetical protein
METGRHVCDKDRTAVAGALGMGIRDRPLVLWQTTDVCAVRVAYSPCGPLRLLSVSRRQEHNRARQWDR